MSSIVDIIKNEDLSLEELGEITREALAKIYTKLETDIGIYHPIGVITSLGEQSYHVDVMFTDSRSHNTGESYETLYYL